MLKKIEKQGVRGKDQDNRDNRLESSILVQI